MALDITTLRQEPTGGAYVSPVRLCLDADGALVDCEDPRAAKLLVGEGCELPLTEAERYGLIDRAEASARAANAGEESEESPAPAEPKRRRGAADRAAKASEDKGVE